MANTIDVLGEEQATALLVQRTITELIDDTITRIGQRAFYKCEQLTTVDCSAVTSIGNSAFQYCSRLTTVNFPSVTSIDGGAFGNCSALTTVDFPEVTRIGVMAFTVCPALTTVILRKNQVATLGYDDAFNNSNNAIIYVPDDLVSSYKAATNWSTYASRIKGISELPTT